MRGCWSKQIAKKRHASSGLRESVSPPSQILTGTRREFDWVASGQVCAERDESASFFGCGDDGDDDDGDAAGEWVFQRASR